MSSLKKTKKNVKLQQTCYNLNCESESLYCISSWKNKFFRPVGNFLIK